MTTRDIAFLASGLIIGFSYGKKEEIINKVKELKDKVISRTTDKMNDETADDGNISLDEEETADGEDKLDDILDEIDDVWGAMRDDMANTMKKIKDNITWDDSTRKSTSNNNPPGVLKTDRFDDHIIAISPDNFYKGIYEDADSSYTNIELVYYPSDDMLIEDNGSAGTVDDLSRDYDILRNTVGQDFLSMVGLYEDDIAYIRNLNTNVDYKIIVDETPIRNVYPWLGDDE